MAANAKGIQLMEAAKQQHGRDTVIGYFAKVLDNAEQAMLRTLPNIHSGQFEIPMDNGAKIQVSIDVNSNANRILIDFEGTSEQQPNNFNAPSAICRAAVLYVMRCLINEDIPLNDGCMRPVTIKLPKASLVNPEPPAAVVAGNVETSQAITEALLGAFGACSGSQGTMNNLTFGNQDYQYYETIAGGSGAGPEFDGASGVQTHMTNSRMTDPEILEHNYPVRLITYGYRRGSGGKGKHSGGDGIVRRFKFLTSMEVNLLSGNHKNQPFALCGAQPGSSGSAQLVSEAGTQTLEPTCQFEVNEGDELEIQTPGGGGFGPFVS